MVEGPLRCARLSAADAIAQGIDRLCEAVAELNRYRSAQIVVADDRIAAIRIGGRFPIRAGDEFLAGIEASFNIRAVKGEDGKVYLFSAEERSRLEATPAG